MRIQEAHYVLHGASDYDASSAVFCTNMETLFYKIFHIMSFMKTVILFRSFYEVTS